MVEAPPPTPDQEALRSPDPAKEAALASLAATTKTTVDVAQAQLVASAAQEQAQEQAQDQARLPARVPALQRLAAAPRRRGSRC